MVQTHVLVVGDDCTHCLRIAGELLQHAYRVTVCTDADRALARVADGDVDVVLVAGLTNGVARWPASGPQVTVLA